MTAPLNRQYNPQLARSILAAIRYEPAYRVGDVAGRLGLTHGQVAPTFAELHRNGNVEKTAAGWESTGKRLPRIDRGRKRKPRERVVYDAQRALAAPLSSRTEQAIAEWRDARRKESLVPPRPTTTRGDHQ